MPERIRAQRNFTELGLEYTGRNPFRMVDFPRGEFDGRSNKIKVSLVDDRLDQIIPLGKYLLRQGYEIQGLQVKADHSPELKDYHAVKEGILGFKPRVAVVDKGLSLFDGRILVPMIRGNTSTVLWTGEHPSRELSEYGADRYIMKTQANELLSFLAGFQ